MNNFTFSFLLMVFHFFAINLYSQPFNWEQIPIPAVVNEVKALDSLLFIKSDSFLYKSVDQGLTWQEISSPPYTLAMNHLEPVTDLGYLFISSSRGLAIYDVATDSTYWSYQWSWDATTWSCFGQSGDLGYSTIRSYGSSSGVLAFSNGSWNQQMGTPPNNIPGSEISCTRVVCNPINPEIAFARGTNNSYRTIDNGSNWLNIPYEVFYVHNYSGNAYTLASNRYSLDDGLTWHDYEAKANVFKALLDTLFVGRSFGGERGVHLQSLQNLEQPFIPIGLEGKKIISLELQYPFLYAITDAPELFRLNIQNLELEFTNPDEGIFPISIDECRDMLVDVCETPEVTPKSNELDGSKGTLNCLEMDYFWTGDTYIASVKPHIDFQTFGGFFYYLKGNQTDHLFRDFDAIFEPSIQPEFQGTIDSIAIILKDVNSFEDNSNLKLRIEFKDNQGQPIHEIIWNNLLSFSYPMRFVASVQDLPTKEVAQIVVVFDSMDGGDEIELERVRLITKVPQLETPLQAFLWSYNAILEGLHTSSWMVKDKGHDPFGELEGVTATAKFAKNTYYARDLGLIDHFDAEEIITSIVDKFIHVIPRGPAGLLSHFTKNSSTENKGEFSTVDHCISLMDLIVTLELIGDPQSQLEDLTAILENTNWDSLLIDGNKVIHGFNPDGTLLLNDNGEILTWGDFGMETIAVLWAYASSRCELGYMNIPPGFGSGFIDNLQAPIVCNEEDWWGNDWATYRLNQADVQINWYKIYNTENPFLAIDSIFGLSAAETPKCDNYLAYGITYTNQPTNDGNGEVITPHFHGMIADIKPAEAIIMWNILRDGNSSANPDYSNVVLFSPWNVTESFRVDTSSGFMTINHLKSSWNLNLLAEGWANYHEDIRDQLKDAVTENAFLEKGMNLLKATALGIINQDQPFKVFPIPTDGFVYIKSDNQFKQNEVKINLFNPQGQLMKSWQGLPLNNRFNLVDCPNGFYTLRFESNGQAIFIQKIIKI